MKARRILHIINLKSGTAMNYDEKTFTEKLQNNELFMNYDSEIFYLTGENDMENIRKRIDEFRPETITAGGGDGTVNLVASVIRGMSLKLGIIPLGSANGLAYDIGVPRNMEDALELIAHGVARPMDAVLINRDHISLHLSDLGINARIVKEFEREGKRGFTGYIRYFFRELFKPQKRFTCSIDTGDNLYRHRALMTIIANASRYRTGANMNPAGRIDDGKFEVVLILPYRRWFWKSLAGAFTGTLDRMSNIKTYECSSALITVNPPEELQVDGEHLGKHSIIRADILKHALNVILPADQ